jgi:hypothetical protein
VASFLAGLAETGYVEGRNFVLEVWLAEDNDRLPALAADLVRRRVAMIFVMPFANDDGRPLGLLVLMRLVSANSFPYRYKGVHDEHSDFAIHPLGSRRRQGMFAYVPAHKTRYVAPCRDNRNATFHR